MIYDGIRIFRRVLPHGVWSVALEDVLYWFLSALLVFQLIYRENDGALRGYALAAVAVGMFIYHQTVSTWLVEHIAVDFKCGVWGSSAGRCRQLVENSVEFVRLLYRFCKKKLKNGFREFIIILFS